MSSLDERSEYDTMPHGTKGTLYVVELIEFWEIHDSIDSWDDYQTLNEIEVIYNEVGMPCYYDVMPDGRFRLDYDIWVSKIAILGVKGEFETVRPEQIYTIGQE